ncbi:MAG: hypothetical protein QXU54_00550 [Candidatus Micrarchaeia archaeon]
MLAEISYAQVLGLPLIMWLGVLAIVSIACTAAIAVLTQKGIRKMPLEWHVWAARIGILLALVHAALALLSYL